VVPHVVPGRRWSLRRPHHLLPVAQPNARRRRSAQHNWVPGSASLRDTRLIAAWFSTGWRRFAKRVASRESRSTRSAQRCNARGEQRCRQILSR
jgi:hypothetical protein